MIVGTEISRSLGNWLGVSIYRCRAQSAGVVTMRHKLASSFEDTVTLSNSNLDPWYAQAIPTAASRIFTCYVKNCRLERLLKEFWGVRLRFSSYKPGANLSHGGRRD